MLTEIRKDDKYAQTQMNALLSQEGISRDAHLDYSCGIFDDEYRLTATGSCFRNTIRCTAVASDHRGEGLLNQIMTHLLTVQAKRGNSHIFLYTKPESAQFFSDIGFYEIVRLDNIVFMENRKDGLRRWIGSLETRECGGTRAAVVLNANPFTSGHRYLVEKASSENELVHVFVVSEDAGPIPFCIRSRLVREGTGDLNNILIHDSGSYIISTATFPGYFLKDSETVIRAQASLDIRIFTIIANKLGIRRRYVGEEPLSRTTSVYNEIMVGELSRAGIECIVVPRLYAEGEPVSASRVRQALHDGRTEEACSMLPETSADYFRSPEARPVIDAIMAETEVIHN